MNLDNLKPNPNNPRIIKKDEFERLKNKVKSFPEMLEKRPIVYNGDTVLGGNQRLMVLRDLAKEGFEIKESYFSDGSAWSEEQKRQFVITDNISDGDWDYDILANQWSDLPLEEWGIDTSGWDSGEVEEDEPPPLPEKAISKLGEVYQLGPHRLMCGDATKIEDVEKLMDGKKADMVFTDPPYGVDYEGGTKDKLKLQNDLDNHVWRESLPNYLTVTKAGASYYICCPPGNKVKSFLDPFDEYCYLASILVWAKNSLVLGHSDYHFQHEFILYGWSKEGSHNFYGDRTQTTLWDINRPTQSKEHPTMKPLALCAKAIRNSSKQDDIVIDLFGGSGSTLIAAEQTNWTCYMMELDPKYVDVIRKRYWTFINKDETGWLEGTPVI